MRSFRPGGASILPPEKLMHTILGANGVVGFEISRELSRRGRRVRQVSRHPRRVNDSDELVVADLLDARATDRAVAGSETAYLVAGLKYDARAWEEQWPRVMSNVIEACRKHRARLVFFDNVYAYGRVEGPMTEETPFNPCSRKGEVRARIATLLLDAMRAREIEALIARAADFYGPRAVQSLTHSIVFRRLARGQNPQWIGRLDARHSFTYTPDAGRAVAVLGQTPTAFGETWHLPTSKEPMSGEQLVRLACELAGKPYSVQVAPRWMLRVMGWFVPVVRENDEMMYQFEHDYVFASAKIESRLGLAPTDYRTGIAETLSWAKSA